MKKRYLAVFLTLIIVLANVPVFAAGTGTLTIENASVDKEYSVYKIFDLSPAESAYLYSIKESNPWYNDVATDAGSPFTLRPMAEGGSEYNVSVKEGADVIAWLQTKITDKGDTLTAEASQTAATARLEFTGLDYGYYFVSSELGSVVTISNLARDVTIIDKNQKPGLGSKEVSAGQSGSWAATATAGMGDTVHFRIKAFTPKYHGDKKVYEYKFVDQLDPGLTFDSSSFILKIDDELLTISENYTIEIAEQKATIILRAHASSGYPANAEVEISYAATVNENAQPDNGNSVSMSWTEFDPSTDPTDPDNPPVPASENLPVDVAASVYVYGFHLQKYQDSVDEEKFLEGAEFKLFDAASGGKEIELVQSTDGQYRLALGDESGVPIAAGTASIFGLDTGTYWLEETFVPVGFNPLKERVKVEISEENTLDGYLIDTINVVNKAGIILPGTGGIGSYIFYLAGGLLMLAALLYLLKKSRPASPKKVK